MTSAAQAESQTDRELRELRATVQQLSVTVQRFVVVLERQLASNDAVAQRSSKALEKMHPQMTRIQAEVRAKMSKRKVAK